MRRVLLGVAVFLFAAVAVALAYAPYLPALIMEGFPGLTLSGRGSYAEVAGASSVRDLPVAIGALGRPLAPGFAEAFAERGGRVLLVYRDGALALEHYDPGLDASTRFNSYSMAKSLVGALVFRALADGRLQSLDQTLGELLPDDPALARITLRRLLEMRAGIHFDGESSLGSVPGKASDTYPNPFGPLARLHFAGLGSIERTLTVTAVDESAFNYQNINTALLAEVLERVTGRTLPELLSDQIWVPSGAAAALWRRPASDLSVSAYCCIYATARDFVRIGVYLAGNGTPDAPFLPEPLWRQFLGLDTPNAQRQVNHYGFHIQQNVLDRDGEELQGPFTYLLGQGGQMLYLMPERGLVVYRAGEGLPLLHSTLYGAWNSTLAQ